MIYLSLVVACSRPKSVLKLLESIQNQENLEKIEVIVAGNTSCLPPLHLWNYSCKYVDISKKHPNIKRNAAIRVSVGKHIAFIDDDAYLSRSWISHALYLIRENPDYVFTGPEKPTRKSRVSWEIYESQKIWICEFSSAHVNFNNEKVHWLDVPFCNCIIPRKYLGMLNEKIPWDIDDFHFFSNLGSNVFYFNSTGLLIFHDRYKESLKEHLEYKWKLRLRTGEKFITHFKLYRKVPGIILIFISPIVLSILFFVHLTVSFLILLVYVFLVFQQASRNFGSVKPWTQFKIIFLIHLITFVSFFMGLFKALVKKLFGNYMKK